MGTRTRAITSARFDRLHQVDGAIGSGHEVAAVVLARGGSAVEACRLACRLRIDCGLPVVLVDLTRGSGLEVAEG